jgi:hypothetical protein
MPKKKAEVIGTVKAPEVVMNASDEQPPISNAYVAEDAEKFTSPTSFDVYNADGVLVRSYTLEIHGENAEALANEFAAHTGGTVK